MKETIRLKAVDMTPEIMQSLENKGMIKCLCPGSCEAVTPEGEVGITSIYASDIEFGSHKLISVTINRNVFSAFGTHPDNEDVILIGNPETKTICFVFSFFMREDLNKKIQSGNLCSDDFIALTAKFNDPEVSFFTVLKGTPHGESTVSGVGKPPTFFVAKPSDLPLDITDFKGYVLNVE